MGCLSSRALDSSALACKAYAAPAITSGTGGTDAAPLNCRLDAMQLRTKAAETTHWKDVPHLDEAFIRQNMKDLVALQIIGPPRQPQPQSKAAGR